jgi:hypothetical protein
MPRFLGSTIVPALAWPPGVIGSVPHLPVELLGICNPDELRGRPIDEWVLPLGRGAMVRPWPDCQSAAAGRRHPRWAPVPTVRLANGRYNHYPPYMTVVAELARFIRSPDQSPPIDCRNGRQAPPVRSSESS